MRKLMEVMRKRVDEFGVSEPVIQLQGADRLIIELAGVEDPDAAIELLGKTARLEFLEPNGNVIVTGADLKSALAQIDSSKGQNEQNYISLEFTSEGAKKFGSATARLVGQQISISLDGIIIQSPRVSTAIMDGRASISGGFATFQEAADIAALLRGGSLPVNIEILSKSTVGPSLGQDSLDKSITALIVGLSILGVFMIAYYRLPGIIADIALVLHATILIWLMLAVKATLTLPGIAGFVLSLGMAVDSNIIIYERIKEELRAGKTLSSAINAGFRRALSTILDSNITTLIAAVVLFFFGTGSVQGFAVTLSLGILSSLFTAITFTRFMLNASASLISNKKLYGAKEA
jgi:preprotein translocase subunit SecD